MSIAAKFYQTCPSCKEFHASWGKPYNLCPSCGYVLDPQEADTAAHPMPAVTVQEALIKQRDDKINSLAERLAKALEIIEAREEEIKIVENTLSSQESLNSNLVQANANLKAMIDQKDDIIGEREATLDYLKGENVRLIRDIHSLRDNNQGQIDAIKHAQELEKQVGMLKADLAAANAANRTSKMWQGEAARLLEELLQAVKRA